LAPVSVEARINIERARIHQRDRAVPQRASEGLKTQRLEPAANKRSFER